MAIKFLQDIDVSGEVQSTSLDINGNADISGNLTGVDTLTATTLNVTNYGLASADIPNNAADTTGSAYALSGSAGSLLTAPSTNELLYTGNIAASTTGIFTVADNSNSIITLNRHTGNYDSQLGFSSNGELYYRSFHNSAINDSTAWRQLVFSTSSANMSFSGIVDITNSTEATDATGDTGALRVEGGISSAGHIYAEGLMSQMGRAETDSETAKLYPLGHYTTGKEVFSIDPTWTQQQLEDYFDLSSSQVAWATESDAPAGWSIRFDGSVGVGIDYNSGLPLIPIDDTSVYFTECWIKNVGSNQKHYMGSIEREENFASPSTGQGNPGSYGYHVMSNFNPGNSWTRVTGYVTGRSDTTTGNFETDANYFSPQALFNYTAGTGTRACIISGWRIIKIDKQEYFADGTAALPAITNYNDPNTGIYFEAADTINISTTGTKRLTVNSDGHILIPDNKQIKLGAGNDLTLYSNGTDGYVLAPVDDLVLQAADDVFIYTQGGEDAIIARGNDSVELYFNNAKKLHTKSDGVDITGELQADTLDIDGNADISGSLTFSPSSAAFINHSTTSQSIKFRLSNSSALDVTPLEITPTYVVLDADLYVSSYIRHTGDSDTLIGFSGNDTFIINTAGTTALTVDSSQNATFAGSLTVGGDLNITGDINSVSVTDLDVTDKTITIAKGAADSSAADGAGIVVDGASASLLYDHTGTQWEFNKPVEVKVGSSAIQMTEYGDGAAIWLDGVNGDMVGGDYFGIHAYSNTSLDFSYGAATKMSMTNAGVLTTAGLNVTSNGSAANGAEIILRHANNNSTDTIGTIIFGNNADTTLSTIVSETNGANNTSNLKFTTSNAGTIGTALTLNADNSATFAGTIASDQVIATVSGGTNFEARKGNGSGAVGFGGTTHQTGLIEGVDGGGIKLYTAGNDVNWGGAWALNTTWSGTGMTVAGTLTVSGADAITIPDYILHASDDSKFGFPSNDNFKVRLAGGDVFTMSTTVMSFTGEVEGGSLDINGDADISGSITNATWAGDTIAANKIATLNQNTTGSSGSCTGNAATATVADQATNLNAIDDRDMAPEDRSYSDDFRIFFTSKEGLEDGTSVGSNWQDALFISSYSDSSGGNPNVLAFDKSEKKIYHYQASATASNWGTPKQIAYTDSDISGDTTGNAATATTATNVTASAVSNAADYFGCFVSSTGTQGIKVANGLKYNPSTNVLTAGKITSDTVSIVENAKSGSACMTITGAGAGNEANIALKIQGTAHGDPVKLKMKGEDAEGGEVGKGLLSFDPASDTFSIGQSSSHNSMAIKIDNSDVATFKNMAQFTAGIDITGTTDATDATGDTGILRCEGGASIAKKLYVGSTITGSADVIAYSDERLKKNVKTLDGKKVLEMRGVSFERTDSGKQSSGVIAQELEKVAPELVIDDGSYKGVAYGNVVGYLIEAIKDQQKQIDELKAIVDGNSK